MNYANIKDYDIADGPGVRVSLFVSGCRNHCPGCFNEETWDFGYGKPFTAEVEESILQMMEPEFIAGFTLLGGEPFEEENQRVLAPFLTRMRERYPKKSIWCYTGYTLERDLLEGGRKRTPCTDPMLKTINVLVDGRFIQEKKNITLLYRGSENQRILLLENGRVRPDGEEIVRKISRGEMAWV